jgi:hypothetical protein
MSSPVKKHLNSKEITKFSSHYLNEGRKQENWEIVHIDIDGKILTAHVHMRSRYISKTDSSGFHLTIFSTLEFLSQLLIIYAHVWAGLPKKTREGWMIESSIRSKSSVRDPENIHVRMEVASIRKVKNNILAVTHSKVFDDSGSFEATLKGFLA